MSKSIKFFQSLKSFGLRIRPRSTLASVQQNGINDNNLSLEEALPFSSVPSVPTVPILKSMWIFLPVIGIISHHIKEGF